MEARAGYMVTEALLVVVGAGVVLWWRGGGRSRRSGVVIAHAREICDAVMKQGMLPVD